MPTPSAAAAAGPLSAAPSRGPAVVGALECMADGWLSGWAHPLDGATPVHLVCKLNGQPVGAFRADQARVQKATADAAHDGFLWRMPTTLWAPLQANATVEVVVAETGQALRGSPRPLQPGASTGRIGGVRHMHLSGWAASERPQTAPLQIELLVDGQVQSQVRAQLMRPDLAPIGLGAVPVGIRVRVPDLAMDGQPHQLALRVAGAAATLPGGPVKYQATAAEQHLWRLHRELAVIDSMVLAGHELVALNTLTALVRRFPEESLLYRRMAELAEQLGWIDQALQAYNAVAPESPESGHALAAQVRLLLALDRWPEARDACQALQASPADAAVKLWASVLVQAVTDPAAAARLLQAGLANETRPTWQAKLLRWALATDLALPLPGNAAWLSDATLAPAVAVVAAAGLMRQAGRRQARPWLAERMAALPPADAHHNPKLPLRLAEFWLDASQPEAARQCLAEAASAMDSPHFDHADQRRDGVMACHEFGEMQGRQTSAASATFVVDYAAMLIRDGQSQTAQGVVQSWFDASDCQLPRQLAARLCRERADHRGALALLEPVVHGQRVPLADTKVWLHSLLDDEQIGLAQAEMERLAPQYAPRELLLFRSQLARLNMAFESAADTLRAAAASGLGKNFAVPLADTLITAGDASAALAMIETGLARQPSDWAWARLQLRWLEEFGTSWADWFQAADQMAPRLGFRARLHLLQLRIHKFSLVGRFETAERLLAHYTRSLGQRWPMSADECVRQRINCAGLWSVLNRTDTAQALLSQVAKGPLSAHHRLALCRTAASLESHTSRNAEKAAAWLSELRPRHHLKLLAPPAAAGPMPIPAQGPPRVAVLLHLYYPDLWDEFWPRLQALQGSGARLFITTGPHGLPEAIARAARQLDPQAAFRAVDNWGFDVGAHWQSLDYIDLGQFDLVLLLQSKKSKHLRMGHSWRANLLHALLGSPDIWQANLAAFSANPQLGMLGSALHRSSHDGWQYPAMRQALQALGMPTDFDTLKHHYAYVGGSMFLIRAHLLADMHKQTRRRLQFPRYEQLSIGHRLDYSLGHAMERAFGLYTSWRGYEAAWRA